MASYKVHLINKDEGIDQTIEVDEAETVLEAAENAGIDMPFSCRAGSCASCCGKMLKGEVDQSEQTFLTDDQIDVDKLVLTCVCHPRSDCTIETHQEDAAY